MQALLSFDKSPPFAAPVRFFVSAPLYGILLGLLVLWDGPSLFASRWTPVALAATHLLTLGVMLQIMLGALIQILPVVAGANLAQPARVAAWVHPLLNLGTLALAGGFLAGWPAALALGASLLGVALLIFLGAATRALWSVPVTSPTIRGLKLALLALAVTALLGGLLVLALVKAWSLPLIALTDLHAAWGLAGWSGVLLAAVAYVVVPMFQLTPGYPARAGWLFPWVMLAALALWSLAAWADWSAVIRVAQLVVALAGAAFCVLTLRLQARRRRARADVTLRYWQLGLGSALAGLALLAAAALGPALAEHPAWGLLLGVLWLPGAFLPFIIGMLYKIIPFLSWLHLQNIAAPGKMAPPVNTYLSDAEMRRQWRVYLIAWAVALASVAWPSVLARPAGLLFAIAQAWLGWNLWLVVRRYRAQGRLLSLPSE